MKFVMSSLYDLFRCMFCFSFRYSSDEIWFLKLRALSKSFLFDAFCIFVFSSLIVCEISPLRMSFPELMFSKYSCSDISFMHGAEQIPIEYRRQAFFGNLLQVLNLNVLLITWSMSSRAFAEVNGPNRVCPGLALVLAI